MRYLYTGPNSGVTLPGGKEVLLFSGKEVDLPSDNSYVKTLVSLGYLRPVEDGKNSKKQTKKEVTENAS